MIFFRYIAAALRFTRAQRYRPDLEWTQDDQLSLATFFNSHTGLKLKAIMTNNVIQFATHAVHKNSPWENGRAVGIAEHVTFIESHLPPALGAKEQSDEEEDHTAFSESPELTV